MIINRAILKVNESEYDILHLSYGFHRLTDAKGRPTTGVRGGDIQVLIESGEDNYLLRQMLLKTICPVKGSIEVLSDMDGKCIRCIEFEKAYIYCQEERMSGDSSFPILMGLAISPVRLDIDRQVRLDRRWPETKGFMWEKFEPEAEPVSKAETEQSFTIEDAYWLDDKGTQIRDLSVDVAVTLYVVLGQFTAGSTINLIFEDEDGVEEASYSGTVNSDGIIILENFKLKSARKEGESA